MKRLLALCSLLAALVAAGCGLGAGATPGNTKLVVTRDFGTAPMLQLDAPKVRGSDTVMRLLQRNAKVTTRFGGGFVQSIDGLTGGSRGGRQLDWFFYVNGVESEKGASAVRLAGGDVIWWDHHDWSTAMRSPAVVGSYPEPFLHGPNGKRLPVRLECSPTQTPACEAVQKQLTSSGIIAAQGGVAQSFTKETLRILVGPYVQLRDDHAVRLLEAGPQTSGVYARPAADGRSIALLDVRGKTVQTLGPGSGLLAAVRFEDDQPVWVVTGTDAAGVAAATRALDEGNLKNRFAVAVASDRAIPLPEAGSGQ